MRIILYPKEPNMLSDLLRELSDYILFIIISIWAGITKYLGVLSRDPNKSFQWISLIYDVIISSFVGMLTIMFCYWQEFGIYQTGAIVGIAAHMGTRAIALMENILKGSAGKISDAITNNKTKS